ncbi:helix-turn-helix domain-containing protein [Actinomadura macrotermitis]|nr:helix-turn-helix domain-containing protein [Actinomadura macrotermitis]
MGALAEEHAAEFGGDGAGPSVRPAIAESWRRSRDFGLLPETRTAAPLVLDRDTVTGLRAGHPLAADLPLVRALLRDAAEASGHLMVVTDAMGHALWAEGSPQALRDATGIGLIEGFCWAETAIGTNGIGTALATGRPEYVYAAEHLTSVLHRWSCAGAPVTDPDSGQVVGCLDLSGTAPRLHPAAVRLVEAAARLVETRMQVRVQRSDERLRERYGRHLRAPRGGPGLLVTTTGRVLLGEPDRWRGHRLAPPVPGRTVVLPDGREAVAEPLGEVFLLRPAEPDAAEPAAPHAQRPLLSLCLLGDGQPYARLNGRRLPLSLRHAEILALLALHPRGLSGDRLSWYLYGDEGSPVTVRAEIHRLRAQLGALVGAKPYRLECDVDADFLGVRRRLDDGDVAGAARLCAGQLLPRSDAPAVRAERDELQVRLRRQILDAGGADGLWAFAQTDMGQGDAEVLDRLRGMLAPDDPRRAMVAARSARLREDG